MTRAEFETIRLLHVEMEIDGSLASVGRLGRPDRTILFEYDPGFPKATHGISPFNLVVQARAASTH